MLVENELVKIVLIKTHALYYKMPNFLGFQFKGDIELYGILFHAVVVSWPEYDFSLIQPKHTVFLLLAGGWYRL